METGPCLEIEAAAFFEQGRGYTCAWKGDQKGGLRSPRPTMVTIAGIRVPLTCRKWQRFARSGLLGEIQKTLNMNLSIIPVREGVPRVCRLLGRWIDTGSCSLESAAAEPIAEAAMQLASLTPGPVLIESADRLG